MICGPIESISAGHDTSEFDCGSQAQTAWLRRHALQAHRTDTSRVRVVTPSGERHVVGYYALAAGAVARASVPARIGKGVPRHPVPVVILTRLGVDLREQGRGLGRSLLKDALVRVASASEILGARAFLVHCENEAARAFYVHLAEFEASPTDPRQLFLLLSDLRNSIGPDDADPPGLQVGSL